MVHPRGEVILIRVPFHQIGGSKIRPAIVVLDSGDDDLVAAPVTSQTRDSKYDLQLVDWLVAGLNVPSRVRLHKVAVLAKSDVVKVLGSLSSTDAKRCDDLLWRTYCSKSDDTIAG
jgi:mRNA interferase MazF